MSIKIGDLVTLRKSAPVRRGTARLRGIVYDMSNGFVNVMWADGQRTGRHPDSLEVISEP